MSAAVAVVVVPLVLLWLVHLAHEQNSTCKKT